jgi:hypothetical protein
LLMCAAMILGRLEIYPVLILCSRFSGGHSHSRQAGNVTGYGAGFTSICPTDPLSIISSVWLWNRNGKCGHEGWP